CRDGGPVHDRQDADRTLSGPELGGIGVRRRRLADRDPALGLLFGADRLLRRRVHEGLREAVRHTPAHAEARSIRREPTREHCGGVAAAQAGAVTGKRTTNSLPRSAPSLYAAMLPPWSSTRIRASVRPTPRPSSVRGCDRSLNAHRSEE